MATETKKKTPFLDRKAVHDTKEKLVDVVIGLLGQIGRGEDDKDVWKARMLAVSNKKLMRLHDVAGEIKTKFGSMEKLAEAAATALGRAKDAHYRDRLAKFTPAKLLDMVRIAQKKVKPTAPAKTPKPKRAPSKKKAA